VEKAFNIIKENHSITKKELTCWITLWVYGWGTFLGLFKKEAMSRNDWKQ